MTITQKRAMLFREWILASIANNEEYYFDTIVMGIPDGDDDDTVIEDIQCGDYDDDIDETIQVYLNAKAEYGSDGYYVNGKVFDNEQEALAACGLTLPERIYKK